MDSSRGNLMNTTSQSAASNESFSSNSGNQAVRDVSGLMVNATTSTPAARNTYNPFKDSHDSAPTQAVIYIVIILAFYFSALIVIVIRYMRKERNQFHLPRYLLKKDRSPPSPTASSSFRGASGRRACANMDNSITADFAEVTQFLSTVSNQLMMDTQQTTHDPNSALLVPCSNNQVQIDTTSV
ncbi:hypothetical protein CHUAL_006829 [Chamberlinius hualienensis]